MKGEYFLTEGINIMLGRGLRMRTEIVEAWLDTGTIAATLETNRHLLSRRGNELPPHLTEETCRQKGITLNPPIAIHETAEIQDSVIGPHASIGAGCRITNARVADSIVEADAQIENVRLSGCFIGRRARVAGRSAEESSLKLNIGDDSTVTLE